MTLADTHPALAELIANVQQQVSRSHRSLADDVMLAKAVRQASFRVIDSLPRKQALRILGELYSSDNQFLIGPDVCWNEVFAGQCQPSEILTTLIVFIIETRLTKDRSQWGLSGWEHS